MPRTPSTTTPRGRGRRRGPASAAASVVDQISLLVSTNEALQRANRELTEENRRLQGELAEIGTALGKLTTAPRGRGRGRGKSIEIPGLIEVKPKRQRKPITDPEQLERRKQALAKARAARAEKLAAARAAG